MPEEDLHSNLDNQPQVSTTPGFSPIKNPFLTKRVLTISIIFLVLVLFTLFGLIYLKANEQKSDKQLTQTTNNVNPKVPGDKALEALLNQMGEGGNTYVNAGWGYKFTVPNDLTASRRPDNEGVILENEDGVNIIVDIVHEELKLDSKCEEFAGTKYCVEVTKIPFKNSFSISGFEYTYIETTLDQNGKIIEQVPFLTTIELEVTNQLKATIPEEAGFSEILDRNNVLKIEGSQNFDDNGDLLSQTPKLLEALRQVAKTIKFDKCLLIELMVTRCSDEEIFEAIKN